MMKISIVATVLNESKSIDQLCQALVAQSLKCGDINIVDGGSVDDTVAKIKKYPQINLYIKNGNRSVGRNYGIKKAKGEIVAITDAGGYPKKDWLEKISKPFENKDVQVVSGYYESLGKTPFEKCIAPYFLVLPDKLSKIKEFFPSSRSVAIRKSIWQKVNYPEKYSHNEDFIWDYQLKEMGVAFHFEPKAIVYWSPPDNIFKAAKTFYMFSLGDAEANIYRPQIQFIYYRYIAALMLLGTGKYALLLIPLVVLYILWAIIKNWRYVKKPYALFWLPIIQIVSDVSIMWGHLKGKVIRDK